MSDQYLFQGVESIEQVLTKSWQMLSRGAAEPGDPFHTAVLGTDGPGGCNLRTVVLRGVLVAERSLICHTDVRSPKVQEIQNNPWVSWLFYHPEQKVQLRLTGSATLHTDDELADEQWQAAPESSKRLYCAMQPPGTPVDAPSSGLPKDLGPRSLTVEESAAGRENYAVIACPVVFIDWLYLRAEGHRRAQFTRGDEGWASTWVIP